MKINRELYKESFCVTNLPNWICPVCDYGLLTADKEAIKTLETEESKKNHSDPDFEPFWVNGFFTGKLTCGHIKCKESLYFSGTAGVDFDGYDIDENDGSPNETYAWFISPKYFSKPLKLFKMQEFYPKGLAELIEQAFGLMWADSAACANKIRSIVEKILDERKVKKYNIVRGKKKPIPLHNRIDAYKVNNPEAAHYFEAVKWIGNVGSHADDSKLKREDLMSAFEMLEQALDILYNQHPKHLKKLAQKIIKRKGPIKPKKLKFGKR